MAHSLSTGLSQNNSCFFKIKDNLKCRSGHNNPWPHWNCCDFILKGILKRRLAQSRILVILLYLLTWQLANVLSCFSFDIISSFLWKATSSFRKQIVFLLASVFPHPYYGLFLYLSSTQWLCYKQPASWEHVCWAGHLPVKIILEWVFQWLWKITMHSWCTLHLLIHMSATRKSTLARGWHLVLVSSKLVTGTQRVGLNLQSWMIWDSVTISITFFCSWDEKREHL